jgi:hypothetical protein
MWTVPLQVGVSQVLTLGRQPISVGLFGRYRVERPTATPEWGLRFIVTFLFPK